MSDIEEGNNLESWFDCDPTHSADQIVIHKLRNREIVTPNPRNNNFRSVDQNIMSDTKLCVKTALQIIPEFDGTSENLHKFITCCEIVHTPLLETEKAKFMTLIPSKLSKKAYDLTIVNKYETWAELKSDFKINFQKSKSMASIQMELFRVQQGRSEDIRSYSSKVEKLLSELNEVCVDNQSAAGAKIIVEYNSKTALQAYQEGLRDPIKLIIKACRFETLKEAISKSLEEERNSIKPNTSAYSSSHNSFDMVCHFCHRKGHIASECHQNNNMTASSNFNRPTLNRNVNYISMTCAYCKKNGHHISVCRKREFNNKQRFQTQANSKSDYRSQQNPENRNGLDQISKNTPHRVQPK